MNTKLATSRMRTGQWDNIIKDFKQSVLKVVAYCAQHGLSRNAYFYWLRKVKKAVSEAIRLIDMIYHRDNSCKESETNEQKTDCSATGGCLFCVGKTYSK